MPLSHKGMAHTRIHAPDIYRRHCSLRVLAIDRVFRFPTAVFPTSLAALAALGPPLSAPANHAAPAFFLL